MKYFSIALILAIVIAASCSGKDEEVEMDKFIKLKVGAGEPDDLRLQDYVGRSNALVDEIHRLNPDLFILTDLKYVDDGEPGQHYLKSSLTGKVYRCEYKKGDIIFIPKKERGFNYNFINPNLDNIISPYFIKNHPAVQHIKKEGKKQGINFSVVKGLSRTDKYTAWAYQENGGNDWYLMAITNQDPRVVPLDLKFLPNGEDYVARVHKFHENDTVAYAIEEVEVDAGSVISLNLQAYEGAAVSVFAQEVVQ